MPKFRWPELKYDIVKAREVTFSRSSTRLKTRRGRQGGEEDGAYPVKMVHTRCLLVGLDVVRHDIQEMLEIMLALKYSS